MSMAAAQVWPRVAPNDGQADAMRALLGDAVLDVVDEAHELTLRVRADRIAHVVKALRDAPELAFVQLMDICGADYPERPLRFDVVYQLLSLTHNRRVRLKLNVDDMTPVPSLTDLFPVAGWFEREVFDLFGVLFDGNPDLRRIVTDYGFQGHPLRKDFPLTGYTELRYSEEAKRVVYGPVALQQDFRAFDFLSPWEGAQYQLPGDEKADGVTPAAPSPVAADGKTKDTPVDQADPGKPGGGGSGGNKD